MKQPRRITYTCEIRAKDADKRQKLAYSIDAGLLYDGFRITAGTYRITVEKLTKEDLKREEKQAQEEWNDFLRND